MAKEKTTKGTKKPVDKKKIFQSAIIIFLVVAMILSVAGTLIYYLFQ